MCLLATFLQYVVAAMLVGIIHVPIALPTIKCVHTTIPNQVPTAPRKFSTAPHAIDTREVGASAKLAHRFIRRGRNVRTITIFAPRTTRSCRGSGLDHENRELAVVVRRDEGCDAGPRIEVHRRAGGRHYRCAYDDPI